MLSSVGGNAAVDFWQGLLEEAEADVDVKTYDEDDDDEVRVCISR